MTNLGVVDYVVMAVYLGAITAIGLLFQKKASSGIQSFFLGGNKIPWWALAASGMASNLDISGTMINTALVYALGASGFFIEFRGGVTLVLPFLMVFMGKWNRRAKVMTMAEWMMLRFGEGKHGNWARVVSAITVLLTTVVMITYFAIGSGKFVGEFLGIPYFLGISPTFWAACLMVGLSMSFTVASGLHGVVWTDVFQSVLILGIIIYVCVAAMVKVTLPDTFLISLPLGSGSDGAFRQLNVTKEEWESVITPSKVWNLGLDSDYSYSIYNYFYLTVTFYSLKVLLDGFGGVSGYMLQRFLSAKNDKEASKLTCLWIFLLSFRWPFIAAVALLGVYYGNVYNPGHVIADPETVLPIVIGELFPVGMKGLLLAGLTAAAISTFDSTVNAAAAYWVKDIYQAFIRPNATPKQLMFHSRVSSVVIVIIGLAVTLITPNINSMWGWVNSGLAGGMLVPLMLRWYWWRLNGMGFAIGTIGGITAGVLQKMVLPDIEEYYALLWSVSVCIVAMLVTTFVTEEPDQETLLRFYITTRPLGFWHPIRQRLQQLAQLQPDNEDNEQQQEKEVRQLLLKELSHLSRTSNIHNVHDYLRRIDAENSRDMTALFFAVPWQVVLFLLWMCCVFKTWIACFVLAILWISLSVVLYFIWYLPLDHSLQREETIAVDENEEEVKRNLEPQDGDAEGLEMEVWNDGTDEELQR